MTVCNQGKNKSTIQNQLLLEKQSPLGGTVEYRSKPPGDIKVLQCFQAIFQNENILGIKGISLSYKKKQKKPHKTPK